MTNETTPTTKTWTDEARQLLVGRTIKDVSYLSKGVAEHDFGWQERGLEILLDDGTTLVLFRDDEGNGPGALAYTTDDGLGDILPVLPLEMK